MNVKDTNCKGVKWINVAEDGDKRLATLKAMMLRLLFLISRTTVNSRGTVPWSYLSGLLGVVILPGVAVQV